MSKSTKIFARASALTGWPDCPRRGASRLFSREIKEAGFDLRQTPRGIAAPVGTSVHAGAALTLREKMATGKLAPLSTVLDCAVDGLHAEITGGVLWDKDTPGLGVAEKQVIKMATAYQTHIAPGIEPLTVEEKLEAETEFGVVLTGQSDVLARDAGGLRDLKTGKRNYSHAPQLGAYSLLVKSNGLAVDAAFIDFVQRVGITKPQPEPISTKYDLAQAETAALSILRHIHASLEVFRHGDPKRGTLPGDPWAFEANPSSMLCGDKYCPAWGTPFCVEHKKDEEPKP